MHKVAPKIALFWSFWPNFLTKIDMHECFSYFLSCLNDFPIFFFMFEWFFKFWGKNAAKLPCQKTPRNWQNAAKKYCVKKCRINAESAIFSVKNCNFQSIFFNFLPQSSRGGGGVLSYFVKVACYFEGISRWRGWVCQKTFKIHKVGLRASYREVAPPDLHRYPQQISI